jgi:preprotein translocase subunit SecG
MYWALIILHVIVCTFLVLVVLHQAGKGGGIGIAFGGGGSQTVFGSSGAGNFLTRLTAVCATLFFLNSLGLAYLSSRTDSNRLQKLAAQKAEQKKTEDAAKQKVINDVEKAREALPKTGETPAGSTAPAPATTPSGTTATPPQGAAPAGSTAPATAPATPPATGSGTTAPPTPPTPAPSTTPPAPATP